VSGQFTRYTLVLTEGPPTPGRVPVMASGDALEYPHPEAVRLVQALGAGGWQETFDGLVFWLPTEPAPAEGLLRRLRRLGDLQVADESEDWLLRWREFHRPLAVGPFYVRPPWQAPREGVLDLCIDAGMAFGTGAHPTTRQCLAGLARLTPSGLVDLGTGSGVLALAAARLAFAPVTGIDADPVALEAARVNARANGLEVDFRLGDVTDPAVSLPAAPVAVGNLSLPTILELAGRVDGRLGEPWRPRRLLLAGLLEEQGEQAAAAFEGYRVRRRAVDEGWLLLELGDSS
jgi:ribosomal protein L11 methyltransferase